MSVEQIVAQFYRDLIERKDWGARFRNGGGDRTGAYPLSLAILHHSAFPGLPVSATRSQVINRIQQLENTGQERFGWGISYNGGCFPSGHYFQGIGWSRIGAHTGGYNTAGWAWVLDGNNDTHEVTAAQVENSARAVVAAWHSGVLAQPRFTHCHHDLNGTACPGRYGCAARQRINARATQIVRGQGNTVPASPQAGGTSTGTTELAVGPFTGFVVATEDGELRIGPSSSYRKVLDVKAGQVLNAAEGETEWHTAIGVYWFPNRRVKKSNGVKRRGLLPGDWPMRDMPRTGRESDELDYAWRELLTQCGYNASNVWEAKLAWLADRGYTSGNGHARMQRALRERTNTDGYPHYLAANRIDPGEVDGHKGERQINGEIRFLNDQRQFLDPAPKHYSHY